MIGRRPFSLADRFVANRRIVIGDRVIQDGEDVSVAELGLRRDMLHAWWLSNLVRCVRAQSETFAATVVPGEHVDVRTSEQRLSRAERKALRRAAG